MERRGVAPRQRGAAQPPVASKGLPDEMRFEREIRSDDVDGEPGGKRFLAIDLELETADADVDEPRQFALDTREHLAAHRLPFPAPSRSDRALAGGALQL